MDRDMSAPVRPQPKAGILDIAAYVPGRESVPGVDKVWKLSSNETPLGPSPKVAEALVEVSQKMALYPDGGSTKLRRAIAEVHGLHEGNIICGNGSDELLNLLTQTYIQPGDEAIYTEHGFLVYQVYIKAAGGTPVVAKESNERTDADAILAAVTDRTRMVFLANPNNPTGTYMPVEEVRRLHAGLRKDILLVLDAAYSEYVRRNDYEAGIELVSSSDNVVMTRTFSKIYGLASMRIGWMYAPASVVDAINRIRSPFNVNAMAIEAGAAAIRDRSHMEEAVAFNAKWNAWLTQELTALGLRVTPSVGNFLLVHFPDETGKTAPEADAFLCSRGYILRAVKAYGFPNALRLTIGAEEANRGVIDTLSEFLKR